MFNTKNENSFGHCIPKETGRLVDMEGLIFPILFYTSLASSFHKLNKSRHRFSESGHLVIYLHMSFLPSSKSKKKKENIDFRKTITTPKCFTKLPFLLVQNFVWWTKIQKSRNYFDLPVLFANFPGQCSRYWLIQVEL